MKTKFFLTDDQLVEIVAKLPWPRSIYVNDRVRELHRAHVVNGGFGFCPSANGVRQRLERLVRAGRIERRDPPNGPIGMYGYEWRIPSDPRGSMPDIGRNPA